MIKTLCDVRQGFTLGHTEALVAPSEHCVPARGTLTFPNVILAYTLILEKET